MDDHSFRNAGLLLMSYVEAVSGYYAFDPQAKVPVLELAGDPLDYTDANETLSIAAIKHAFDLGKYYMGYAGWVSILLSSHFPSLYLIMMQDDPQQAVELASILSLVNSTLTKKDERHELLLQHKLLGEQWSSYRPVSSIILCPTVEELD